MKAKVIKIGNSKGIRIPKSMLQECGLGEEVELVVNEDKIIIYPINKVRGGWEETYKKMADIGDDDLIDQANIQTAWDEDEWEW
jgi:antitoxin MazE